VQSEYFSTLKKSSKIAKAFRKIYDNPNNPLTYLTLLQCDGLALVERFNKTLAKILYKVQYAVESITLNSKLIREWVRYFPEVIDYLNNYLTCLIQVLGSSKWELAPKEVIKLEKVKSRPSTKYKRSVGKYEVNRLKKDDTVHYLLSNVKWEGGMENQRRATDVIWSPTLFKIGKTVVTKNEPILYYLEGNEFTPKRGFVERSSC
ncbi:11868_t:CDS:2, partial [Gigaspora rosea]